VKIIAWRGLKIFKDFCNHHSGVTKTNYPQKWTDVFFTNVSFSLARMEKRKGTYRVLLGTPEGTTLLGRNRHK
jgi:hypothetical protein